MPSSRGENESSKKLPVAKLVVGVVVLGGIAVLILRGFDVRGAIERLLAVIREAGPWTYFVAMALLPAVAVPATVFTLTAGPVFGPKLGMPLVVALSLLAITVNIVITYLLARRALRPFLEKLMTRLGYKLPEMDQGDYTDLAIVMRVTPGIPFFVQNYLLGLAGVPIVKYLVVSCLVSWTYTAGFVLFGDALLHGKGKIAMIAVSLLVVAAVATHWLRKRVAKKKAAAKGRELEAT
jgi:uncharacterized membrane protein YdjX (TVP38/TMEM64 family)